MPAGPGAGAPAQGDTGKALGVATELVRLVYPTLVGQLGAGTVAVDWSPPGRPTVFFPRLFAGIPVDGEGVRVTMDGAGQWQSINLRWSAAGPTGAEDAFLYNQAQAEATPSQQRAIAFLAGLGLVPIGGEFRAQEAITVSEAGVIAVRLAQMDWW